ncbi:MAG: HAD-IIA family hydrolase [Candidatus Krumholzibacteriota bacterium]|nr:HAD-IIA family hydrolase [Candidatus Krumholzibacteriota bacterium]
MSGRAGDGLGPLADTRHWLFDVEGTLVRDKSYAPLPGAPDTWRRLRERGDGLAILTNNTTHTREELAARLAEAGFPLDPERIVSGQGRLPAVLREQGVREAWLLGPPALRRVMEAAGVAVRELDEAPAAAGADPRALVIGFLDAIDVARMGRAAELATRPEFRILALHKSRLYRDGGRVVPGLGAWVAAIEHAAGKEARVLGKPAPELFREGARVLGAPTGAVCMVGDDPFADLAPARAVGMHTLFVLSGKYDDAAVLDGLPAAARPDFTLSSIAAL